MAKSSEALPLSGWNILNSQAFGNTDAGMTTSNAFVANPVCINYGGYLYVFYEAATFSGTRTLPSTLWKRTKNPEDANAWENLGMAFYDLGRRCFPNSVTKENGKMTIYVQNGPGALSSGGLALGKVSFDENYLIKQE